MDINAKIYVAGHQGMVGSGIVRCLSKEGYNNIVTRTFSELNLCVQENVASFFKIEKPDYVFLAAAKVGGINANSKYPAEFLYENLMIQNNVIHQAYLSGVKKLCFLGSSCIYPRECPQPMKEKYFFTGPFESTNEGYAIAKSAGYKLCSYYTKQYGFKTISLMPCNLYGTNDNFNLVTSHVLSALVKRFSDAVNAEKNTVTLWGTGVALREFLHVDDLAKICVYLMNNYDDSEFINVGSGKEICIKDLAYKIAGFAGFKGKINWDSSKPDGMPRKLMDISKLNKVGIEPEISLDEGIKIMIQEYIEKYLI
jgi:GDP-L-fucose synthase